MSKRLLAALCLLLACACAQAQASRVDTLEPAAPGLADTSIRVRVYLPPGYDATQARYDVLYVNDGQDMEAVGLQATLERLYGEHAIRPLIVAAIDMPPDRMAGYGVFDRASVDCPVYDWTALGAGQRIPGPAFVESPTTTVIVPPGDVATVAPSGDLHLDLHTNRSQA